MKKVLIILSNFNDFNSKGKLNELLAEETKIFLQKKGYEVTIDEIKNGYIPKDEVQKILEHDYIIFQYPIWWFNTPWKLKKWIDDVFMEGYNILWKNDGRVEGDNSKKYGSGGLIKDKKYMLSITMNAPLEAFDNSQFLKLGLDNLLSNMHMSCEFIGLKPLKIKSFMANDVVKSPNINLYLKNLKATLEENF